MGSPSNVMPARWKAYSSHCACSRAALGSAGTSRLNSAAGSATSARLPAVPPGHTSADDGEGGRALQRPSPERGVARLAVEARGVDLVSPGEIQDGDVRGRAGGEGAAGQSQDGGRPRRKQLDQPAEADQSRGDEAVQAEGHRRLQPYDAESGRVVLDLLVVHGVGRVIGGDAVHGALANAMDQGLPVLLRAQGWV